jgi:hypothetical protein
VVAAADTADGWVYGAESSSNGAATTAAICAAVVVGYSGVWVFPHQRYSIKVQ